jgi:hypothetical protein
MEKLRKKLLFKARWTTAVIILLGIIDIVFMIYKDKLPDIPEFVSGYQLGIFISVEVLLAVYVVKYVLAIKSDEALKKMYIQETDERKRMIRQMAGSNATLICYISLIIATVVAGYFNEAVFFTLLGVIVFTALVMGSLKLYFWKKY